MPRKPTFVTDPRTSQYAYKRYMLATMGDRLTPTGTGYADSMVKDQVAHWNQGMGVMHRVWVAVRDRVLTVAEVKKVDYMKYKAFVGEYVSKVQMKGSETSDMCKAKWINNGCDADVLNRITDVIGEVIGQ